MIECLVIVPLAPQRRFTPEEENAADWQVVVTVPWLPSLPQENPDPIMQRGEILAAEADLTQIVVIGEPQRGLSDVALPTDQKLGGIGRIKDNRIHGGAPSDGASIL